MLPHIFMLSLFWYFYLSESVLWNNSRSKGIPSWCNKKRSVDQVTGIESTSVGIRSKRYNLRDRLNKILIVHLYLKYQHHQDWWSKYNFRPDPESGDGQERTQGGYSRQQARFTSNISSFLLSLRLVLVGIICLVRKSRVFLSSALRQLYQLSICLWIFLQWKRSLSPLATFFDWFASVFYFKLICLQKAKLICFIEPFMRYNSQLL